MNNQRRRYFRIEDTLSFTVLMIDPSELQTQIDNFWNEKPVYGAHHRVDHQIEQQLKDFNVIEKEMPELARYLSVLQAQVDSLTAKALSEQISSLDRQKVNLSGQGMSYMADQKLIVGNTVKLDLELLSSNLMITIFAQVVSIVPMSGQNPEQYRTSLDFTHIYEADQALLVKRINTQQLKDIVAAKSITDE
ncbi:MAG: c-di-GMP-binding flagellar brake protein YcgR [Candidatus Azotimanducaceae bacterium]|jgi:c-di-GMP-binding flagellar brake protein YcgR